jgi:hypothetical protein
MIRLFVRHDVADFQAWKKVYDEFDSERSGMGVTGHAVFQSESDPNNVTVVHDFESMETARSFLESARLKEIMGQAGVTGEPNAWFTTPT